MSQLYRNDAGDPLVCDQYIHDGHSRRCTRCGWWRTTHRGERTTIKGPGQMGAQLCQALGLDADIVMSLTLRWEPTDITTIDATMAIDEDTANALANWHGTVGWGNSAPPWPAPDPATRIPAFNAVRDSA